MTEAKNPWLSHPAEPEPDTPVAIEERVRPATGPVAPQRGVPAPDLADQLPLFDRRQNADVWWLGVHGGAGESSLSGVLPGSAAADHGWPQTPGEQPARVVLVARSNMRGLRAAQAAATQWASGLVPGVDVLGLDRCEVPGVGALDRDHRRRQVVDALLAGPDRPRPAAAVPHPVGKAR